MCETEAGMKMKLRFHVYNLLIFICKGGITLLQPNSADALSFSSAYVSYGGLLMRLQGDANNLHGFEVDSRVYLLMKKLAFWTTVCSHTSLVSTTVTVNKSQSELCEQITDRIHGLFWESLVLFMFIHNAASKVLEYRLNTVTHKNCWQLHLQANCK